MRGKRVTERDLFLLVDEEEPDFGRFEGVEAELVEGSVEFEQEVVVDGAREQVGEQHEVLVLLREGRAEHEGLVEEVSAEVVDG